MKSYDGPKFGHARSRHTVRRRIAASTPYVGSHRSRHALPLSHSLGVCGSWDAMAACIAESTPRHAMGAQDGSTRTDRSPLRRRRQPCFYSSRPYDHAAVVDPRDTPKRASGSRVGSRALTSRLRCRRHLQHCGGRRGSHGGGAARECARTTRASDAPVAEAAWRTSWDVCSRMRQPTSRQSQTSPCTSALSIHHHGTRPSLRVSYLSSSRVVRTSHAGTRVLINK